LKDFTFKLDFVSLVNDGRAHFNISSELQKKLIYVLSALMVFEKHTLLLHLHSQLNMKYAFKCLILVFKKILNFQ